MDNKTVILIPVFNDWDSLSMLLEKLEETNDSAHPFNYLIVDDGSFKQAPNLFSDKVQMLKLTRNLGHQKAIAIGLAYIKENIPSNYILIMDGDGEDRPEDCFRLVNEAKKTGKIVFAKRKERHEGVQFQLFYRLYKFLFTLLTGKKISYGNFLAMPSGYLKTIVHYSELWSSLPGGILKSGFIVTTIDTNRGKRYFGSSKMTFYSLVLHGLGTVSVFIDLIASRLLILSVSLILLCLSGMAITLAIRSFTDWAIPGWTSIILVSLFIILLQVFLVSLFTVFLYNSAQVQRKFIPAKHYKDYIINA